MAGMQVMGNRIPGMPVMPALYPTILSGDIGTTNNTLDNSDHVVTASNTDSTAVLDGFYDHGRQCH